MQKVYIMSGALRDYIIAQRKEADRALEYVYKNI